MMLAAAVLQIDLIGVPTKRNGVPLLMGETPMIR
jgi:NADH:ubiquinone oxidoreductase subunit K